MLADGECVYKGGTKQLLPYFKSLNLECPPYNNPADYGKYRPANLINTVHNYCKSCTHLL